MLLNIVFKDRIKIEEDGKEKYVPTEYHIGSLEEKIELKPTDETREEINIRKIGDYTLNFTRLLESIEKAKEKIEKIEYCLSPEFEKLYCANLISQLEEITRSEDQSSKLVNLDIDRLEKKS